MNPVSYPSYSRSERIVDGTVHVVGVILAIAAVTWLFIHIAASTGWGIRAALVVYSVALLAMLAASGAYHILADTAARPLLRRLDHAAIYVKIAGTFTPLAVLLGTGFGYLVLGLVWVLALFGAAGKLMAARGQLTHGTGSYLALGWLGIALILPLVARLTGVSLGLIAAGALLYSAGVIFYSWEKLRFATAIWHGFVLVASGCFFAGISAAVS